MELVSIVESLLFASQEPLTLVQMANAVKETAKDLKDASEGPEPPPNWISEPPQTCPL